MLLRLLLLCLSLLTAPWNNSTMAQTNPAADLFLTEWTNTSTKCDFMHIYDFDHDSEGNVLIADFRHNRVCRFNLEGQLLQVITNKHIVSPHGLVVDKEDHFVITNHRGNRVQKFSPSGELVKEWGATGQAAGQFKGTVSAAINRRDEIYVADYENNRIQKFDSEGNFILSFGEFGKGPGQFHLPHAVAINGQGNIYVVDRGNSRIQIFDGEGNLLRLFDVPNGEPLGMVVDREGNIYVADMRLHQVIKFDAAGKILERWGRQGDGDENKSPERAEFSIPTNVRIDQQGKVYVSEQGNSRIQIFSPKAKS